MRTVEKTDAEWRSVLSPKQYRVMREKGTERPFSGKYEAFWEEGEYKCGSCGSPLFESDAKFDAGCGWPSFAAPAPNAHVEELEDRSYGMLRTEVQCANCGAHLGHVFDDGPAPSGKRYCINSTALSFEERGRGREF